MHVFVAGATGALGRRLIPALLASGHGVTATTRSLDKAEELGKLGAQPVIVNGLDATGMETAVTKAKPDAIIHQMTALAGKANLRRFDDWFATTNQLRTRGTDVLLSAARTAGVTRLIAQSYTGWSNPRTGGPVKTEADGLDPHPHRSQRQSITAIRHVDETVPRSIPEGLVLRYGNFYGPGGSDSLVALIRKRRFPVIGDGAGVWSWIHLDDAATATVAALERGSSGVYNITDDDPASVSEWLPYLADAVGAKAPRTVPTWLGRILAGPAAVQWMTEGRGSSNAKAKRELDWVPRWRSWRQGFRHGLGAA